VTARQWIDDNLPIMFENHLKHHPEFKPDEDYPVAQRAARKPISTLMQTYAAAIKSTIPTFATEDKMTKKFAKPPKTTQSKLQPYKFDPEEFPKHTTNNTTNTTMNNKLTQTSDTKQTESQSQHASPNTTQHKQMKQSIMQTVNKNIKQMISDKLQTKLQPLRKELSSIQADINRKHTQVTDMIIQMQAQLMALLNILSPPSSSPMEVGGN